eukprot:9285125-Alexandrium_andersonii.AAC.1
MCVSKSRPKPFAFGPKASAMLHSWELPAPGSHSWETPDAAVPPPPPPYEDIDFDWGSSSEDEEPEAV